MAFSQSAHTTTDDEPAERIRTDRGTAEGADDVALDPWGSSIALDHRKLFEEFGIEKFDEVLDEASNPHYLMCCGVISDHRDYRPVLDTIQDGDDFAVLSGFVPTGDPHIGHKLVFDEIAWHQEQGGDAYDLIADMEAHSARGIPWGEINEHGCDYLLSLIALGFDPEEGELYRRSDNDRLQRLTFEFGGKANFSEFQSTYDFDGETSASHMQSVVTQMADILYPQLDDPRPTVIPVGPDQDPHIRFARDLVIRIRFFKVTEALASFELDDTERPLVTAAHDVRKAYAEDADMPRCGEAAEWLAGADLDAAGVLVSESVRESTVGKLENAGVEPLHPRVRLFARQTTDEAFEALIEDIEGEKRRYNQHIDTFDMDVDEAEDLAREVEAHHGGCGFIAPPSIYHRFTTGLTGGKMSSPIPASHISLLDAPEEGYDKVKSATTGGRNTADKQHELGGEADKCPVYELYAYLLTGDDDELAKEVYDECVGDERLCGGCKEQAATIMREFLEDHHEKREKAAEILGSLGTDLETERQGVATEH